MDITGIATSGKGHGTWASCIPWFRATVEQTFGLAPVPGTFNLTQVSPMAEVNQALLSWATVLVPPAQECSIVMLLPVLVPLPGGPAAAKSPAAGGSTPVAGNTYPTAPRWRPALLVRPLTRGYPPNQIELMADVHLRTLLGVQDGDAVTVKLVAGKGGEWVLGRAADAGG